MMMFASFKKVFLWMCLAEIFLVCADENLIGSESIHVFRDFHKCMVGVSSTPHSHHVKCRDTKKCFDQLFDNSEDYLSAKVETKVKMDIELDLNVFSDCKDVFTTAANESLHCQLEEIRKCANQEKTGDLCGWLKSQSYCLGPYALKCSRRVFPSILRRISLGMWESLNCHKVKEVEFRQRSENEDQLYQSLGTDYATKKTSYATPKYYATTGYQKYRMQSINITSNITGRDGAHLNISGRMEEEEYTNLTRLDRGYPVPSETSPPSGRGNAYSVTPQMYNVSSENSGDQNFTLQMNPVKYATNASSDSFNKSVLLRSLDNFGDEHSFFSRDIPDEDVKDNSTISGRAFFPYNVTSDGLNGTLVGDLDFADKANGKASDAIHDTFTIKPGKHVNGTVRQNLSFIGNTSIINYYQNASSGRFFELFFPQNFSSIKSGKPVWVEHNHTSTTFPPQGRQFDSISSTTGNLSSTTRTSSSANALVPNALLILPFVLALN